MPKLYGRRSQIKKKAEESGEELTTWAREEGILGKGERLYVTIEIGSDPSVHVDVEEQECRLPFDKPPTAADWKKFFSLPYWTEYAPHSKWGQNASWRLGILKDLKARGNVSNMGSGFVTELNGIFLRRGYPFRLIRVGEKKFALRVAQ
ncbi:hypothetical protein KW785_03540 [Candidatus Parcubacteria bacterium]|nr:hypothetical protein [Candidatus Parcubacteria bacterium]